MLGKLLNWLDERAIAKHRIATLKKIAKHGWTATYVYGEGDDGHIDRDHGQPEAHRRRR